MFFKVLWNRFKKAKDPVGYWRKRGAVIGNGCSIFSSVGLGSEPYLVTIGNHVRLTNNVQLITHDGGVWVLREMYPELSDIDLFGKIKIGNNVHVGTDARIMPGVTIGNNCIIGVGAIVTKDIPDNSIAVGIPARVIKTVDEYKEKNENRFEHTKGMTASEKKSYLIKKYKNEK